MGTRGHGRGQRQGPGHEYDQEYDQEHAARVFTAHRHVLVGVAYRILGEVAEAEDAVQEAWPRWAAGASPRIVDARGYLIRVTTRLAIDRLRRLKARREAYVGPWLPEPLFPGPDIADEIELSESISMAMLVVLETLSPLERAVFVLREAFAFCYPEIAETLGRSEDAVRQLAHRARRHVQARRPRFDTDQATRRRVTERFMAACRDADLQALMEQLAPGVTLVGDGGGRARGAPRRPIHGADKVARFLHSGLKSPVPGVAYQLVTANGGPAILITMQGTSRAVVVLDVADELIETIHLIVNPDKLPTTAGQAAMDREIPLDSIREAVHAEGSRADKAARIAELLRVASGYRWVGIYEIAENMVRNLAWSGPSAPAHPTFPTSQGLTSSTVATRATVVVNDVTADPRYLEALADTRAEMIVPILDPASGGVVGTIDVESDRANAFSLTDRRTFEECAEAILPMYSAPVTG
ncbi:MAG: sigma-70 family RNA polymerase sigma factor [Streptosporangiales bacterium]|nr:sigma-70 family RNA polymerase sigma factor [Streptosporangiales bacterium]